jgi:Na+/melibiose symporter-like transporter
MIGLRSGRTKPARWSDPGTKRSVHRLDDEDIEKVTMKEAELSSLSSKKKKRRPPPNNNNNQNYASMHHNQKATAALEVEEPEQLEEQSETLSLLSSIHSKASSSRSRCHPDDEDNDQDSSHQQKEERRSENGRPTLTPTTTTTAAIADNDRHYYYSLLFPLCLVSFMDAISFMIVAPSLIFFVIDILKGNKEWYGIIMSSFSLASFITKPILGYVCDHYDNFRMPYLVSAGIATIGGLVYFYASNVPSHTTSRNNIGLWLLLLGRCLGGIGSANSTLGFTYIAKVVPENDMTQANAFLSMMRVIGMTLAPASFAILARIPPTTVSLGGGISFQIDSLNSVGLLLAACNALEWIVLYIFLQEPPIERVKAIQAARHMNSQSFRHHGSNNTSMRGSGIGAGLHHHGSDDETKQKKRTTTDWRKTWEFVKACFCFEILLFVFGILCLNSNFQLLETSLAPASNDALGWGPVQVSMLFGANAVFLLLIIAWTFYLSSIGVDDFDLLLVGLILSVVSYLLLYGWWQRGTAPWKFVTPVMLSTGAFPFLGAPTRSLYTKVVAAKSRLRNHQGTMQVRKQKETNFGRFCCCRWCTA